MTKQKSLPIINNSLKCFDAHSKHGISCNKVSCQHHIDDLTSQNCVIIAAQKGPHTLQNIGKIYGLTRMRICQIEKNIIQKLKNSIIV